MTVMIISLLVATDNVYLLTRHRYLVIYVREC